MAEQPCYKGHYGLYATMTNAEGRTLVVLVFGDGPQGDSLNFDNGCRVDFSEDPPEGWKEEE